MNLFSRRAARLGLLALCFAWGWGGAPVAGTHAAAAGQPVTVKELCLLLRGGYTGDEVLRETTGRPLLEPLDADAEKALRAAGADARLVAALKTSHPALTDAEAAAARQRQADLDRRLAAREGGSPRPPTAAPTTPGGAPPAASPPAQASRMAGQFRNQLVTYRDGHWQPYDESTLATKQIFLFYFATQADAKCRQFTPRLLQFYRDFAPTHPAFEVVFYSLDRSSGDMEDDVRQNAMPWPALAFDRLAQQPDLASFGQQGAPRLMLVDSGSHLIADSFAGGKYVGPQHVLDELSRLATGASSPGPAAGPAAAAAPAPTPAGTPNPQLVANLLRGKLTRFENGTFVPLATNPLESKKVIAIYLSTYVSAPGRRFSPDLVKFYQRIVPVHPEFEVVALSGDRSVYDMGNMMRSQQMPWPAVKFDEIKGMVPFNQLADRTGASRLVVVNNLGQFVADYAISLNNPNVGKVLDDLEQVIAHPAKPSLLAPPAPGMAALPQ